MAKAGVEALVADIELSLAAGFNGARLHQKVFEERFHYWADRLGVLERNILRIGAFEVLYRDDVPDQVAVSEAVGLARDLSTDESPPFVNGLLAALARLAEDQARQAIGEADQILFLTDARAGLTPADEAIARELRRSGKPVRLVVNKAEGMERGAAGEFFRLGFGEPALVSAEHGQGVERLVGEVLDPLWERATPATTQAPQAAHDAIRVAIVGRPNVGKSTLFNRLTNAGVYAANQLFATLDTTARKLFLPGDSTRQVVLSDTVGFIRHLPHGLVAAFRSTLEETIQADLLLHVVDANNANRDAQVAEVNKVLEEIGAQDIPQILVLNKIDLPSADPDRVSEEIEEIVGIDASAALRMPGVRGVLLPDDTARMARPFGVGATVRVDYYPMAIDRVRFVGEPVAVVVARSRYLAEDALDAVHVEYEPLPAVVDPEHGAGPEAPALHDTIDGGIAPRGLDVEQRQIVALPEGRQQLRRNVARRPGDHHPQPLRRCRRDGFSDRRHRDRR